nr:reverse transcriptase domain-containing protein [Tanacetum cinerariifolium]
MAEQDEEKTTFYTDQGTYCYTKMLFGLKNAGATYQRLADTAFQSHIGQNLKANAITQNMGPDAKLVRKAGSAKPLPLSLSEKSLPFFETLKNITKENKDDYWWIEDVDTTFQELKKTILNLPSLTTSLPKETRTLHDAERYYALLEKLALALRHVSRRLRSDALIPRSTLNTIDQQIDYKEEWVLYMDGHLVSNAQEYEALLASLRIAKKMRVQSGFVNVDSKLVASQINGNYEACNRDMIKKRKGWVDELPNVLWAHQTSLKTSNGKTSHNLTFRSEVVISAEIGMPTHRTRMIKEGARNEQEMRLNLDLLQERREASEIREAMYKMKMEHYYNKRVRPASFKVGEYVYQKNMTSRMENLEELGPKWKGPYLVTKAYQNGSYKLQTMDDREVSCTWHAINLRRCYL